MSEKEKKIFKIAPEGERMAALVSLEFIAGLTMGVIGLLSGNDNFKLGAAALVGSSLIKATLIGYGFREASREFHAKN